MLAFSPLDIFTFLAPPLEQLLKWLTQGFNAVAPLSAIGAFGLAVIITTILIRAVLFPIFNWQLRTSRRIQAEQRRVAPQISALRKKYKGEPQKLSAEMNKVYKEHGISPFSTLSGCIPALVQLPVLIGLYNAIRNATGTLTQLHISKHFLWIDDLSQSAAPNGNWNHVLTHPSYLVLPLLAAVFTFAQSRMMMQPQRADMSDQERSAAAITKQMTLIFPVMIVIFGMLFPQGLAIYWVTGTMVMVLQQWYVVGWGGLKVPAWWPGAGRVTPLSFPPGDALPKPALSGPRDSKTARSAQTPASRNGARPNGAAPGGDEGQDGEARPAAAATAQAGQRPRTASQRSAAARARASRRRRRQH